MIMRSIVLAMVLLAFVAVPAYAATAWTQPLVVGIPLGGNSTATLYILLNTTDYIGQQHWVTLTVLNASTLNPSDKLNISVLGYTTYKIGVGSYTFSYTPTTAGLYTFTLVLSTNNTNLPSISNVFIVQVEDQVVNASVIPPTRTVTATIFGASIIPELATLALSATGLIAVGLIMRRK